MQVISRAEAKAAGLARYFTGEACKHGHVADRWVANSTCLDCAREKGRATARKWRANSPETARERSRQDHAAHAAQRNQASRERNRKRYAEDPERARERRRKWRADNIERARETERRRNAGNAAKRREYRRNIRDKTRPAKRRAAELQATPAWADSAKIAAFYSLAKELERAIGIPHQVEHVIPVQGKKVCGLHVHENLRVVSAAENDRKGTELEREHEDSLEVCAE